MSLFAFLSIILRLVLVQSRSNANFEFRLKSIIDINQFNINIKLITYQLLAII